MTTKFGTPDADQITGTADVDLLYGLDGADTIDGGEGDDFIYDYDEPEFAGFPFADFSIDTLRGGGGNDVLFGANQDRFDGGAGIDRACLVMHANGSFDLDFSVLSNQPGFVLTLPGGGTLVNVEQISVYAGKGSDRIVGTNSDDLLYGGDGFDKLLGGAGADELSGGIGADRLEGGLGADDLYGGSGDDTLVIDRVDHVFEFANQGTDRVVADFTFTLGKELENLTLSGARNLDGFGNAARNDIVGNAGRNELVGRAGDDFLHGGGGNDQLAGGDGNDKLDGGAGADTMVGGDGYDEYHVDHVGDEIVERAGPMRDSVLASINFILPDQVENLTLTGDAMRGTGNNKDNELTGNAEANVLIGLGGRDWIDGGAGADVMKGGAGADTYFVDSVDDVVVENASDAGVDFVTSVASFTLGAGVEDLELVSSEAIYGTGNALGNYIDARGGDNVLMGLGGDDRLSGGEGDDQIDGGSGADELQGGGGVDYLYGGDGNDWLQGDALDTLAGGAGDDEYSLLIGGAEIVESSGGGADHVSAYESHTLTSEVENLTVFGATVGTIVGTGNDLGNVLEVGSGKGSLFGLDGADTLIGHDRADTLTGGAGADTFVFRNSDSLDTVADFVVGEDVLSLNGAEFGLAAGALSAGNFHVGNAAADGDDRIIYNAATGRLYVDPDGVGGAIQIQFASLTSGLALTEADFIVT